MDECERVLDVSDLTLNFYLLKGVARILDSVHLSLHRREILGLIGESGSGKTVTAMSILKLLPQPPAKIESGKAQFGSVDLLKLTSSQLRRIRGARIGMIFQEPAAALDPFVPIGRQIAGVMRLHGSCANVNRKGVTGRIVELLELVGMPRAERILAAYPHELSGGMQQRAMIARVLACEPEVVIADEPTSSLDVTTQERLLNLFKQLREDGRISSSIVITHSFGIVAQLCDTVYVMYSGCIVERAPVLKLFAEPCHPYTRALMKAVPDVDRLGVDLESIEGSMPSPFDSPSGCRFRPRCPEQNDRCIPDKPSGVQIGLDHWVWCHLEGRR